MRWGLDLLLSLIGVLTGLLSVYGLTAGYEWFIVVLVWIVLALVIGQFAQGKYFLNGFVVGLVASLLQSMIVYMMFDTYFVNTPKMKEVLEKVAQAGVTMTQDDLKSRSLIWSPLGAVVAGAILGLFALGAGKIFGKKMQPPIATEPVETPADDVANPPA